MAITTTTISRPVGWANTDVILQLEEAFTWLGWHGGTHTGIITGINVYNGGGYTGPSSTYTYDEVFQSSSSGIGTGASFYIFRSSGSVNTIYVNRPGYGYTDGEVVQISSEDIGGSINGAVGLALTVFVAGNGTPIGYGSTNSFYDKDVTNGATHPWGALRLPVQENKQYGDTYRVFQIVDGTMRHHVGSGFHPWDTTNAVDKGNLYPNRFAGTRYAELPWTINTSNRHFINNGNQHSNYGNGDPSGYNFASSSSYQLDLNIFRSSIDPKFAVISYRQPTLSSLKLSDNTFHTFIIHNFTTNLWDLDYLFLGGFTEIVPFAGTTPSLRFRTAIGGESYINSYPANSSEGSNRCAEYGYVSGSGRSALGGSFDTAVDTIYSSNELNVGSTQTQNVRFYFRNDRMNFINESSRKFKLSSNINYNAVIKTIPLNNSLIPSPYYIPDDFVLINFQIDAPSVNIQQGDTITISGSEVYTVIQGAYYQTGVTAGVLFCGRTV